MYDSRIKFHYIDNDVWTSQPDNIGNNVKIRAKQSTSGYNPYHYKEKQIWNEETQKGILTKHISKNERLSYKSSLKHNNIMTGCTSMDVTQNTINSKSSIQNGK